METGRTRKRVNRESMGAGICMVGRKADRQVLLN